MNRITFMKKLIVSTISIILFLSQSSFLINDPDFDVSVMDTTATTERILTKVCTERSTEEPALPYGIMRQIQTPGENIVFSPKSLEYLLCILAEGAEGETAKQIAAVAGVSSPENFVKYRSEELKDFEQRISEVNINNSLWIDSKYPVHNSYKENCEKKFNAETFNLNFNLPTASDYLNEWIDKKTHSLIKDLFPSHSPLFEDLIAINTIYLKAAWPEPWTKLEESQVFFNSDSTETKCPFLFKKENIQYAESEDAISAGIALGKNRDLRLYFFLPKDKTVDPITLLDKKKVTWLHIEEYGRPAYMFFPEFKITSRFDGLKNALEEYKMKDAFDSKADFSRISKYQLILNQIIQEAKISISEKGVEAAAATATQAYGSIYDDKPQTPIILKFDRPFAYKITDRKTGAILFAGVVYKL